MFWTNFRKKWELGDSFRILNHDVDALPGANAHMDPKDDVMLAPFVFRRARKNLKFSPTVDIFSTKHNKRGPLRAHGDCAYEFGSSKDATGLCVHHVVVVLPNLLRQPDEDGE